VAHKWGGPEKTALKACPHGGIPKEGGKVEGMKSKEGKFSTLSGGKVRTSPHQMV